MRVPVPGWPRRRVQPVARRAEAAIVRRVRARCRRRSTRRGRRHTTPAPAFSATISRGRPGSSSSASISIARDSAASATRRLRLAAIAMPKSSGCTSYSRTTPSRNSPTQRRRAQRYLSMPSRPQTTIARSAPSSCSTRTWMPTRSGWNTPIGYSARPRDWSAGRGCLNSVRTPISRRTGATTFMAGWCSGANMKPMPVSLDALRHLRRRQLDVRAERFQHIGSARTGRHAAPAVLGDLSAGCGDHEHARGRDV